jgi:hypothetical protein
MVTGRPLHCDGRICEKGPQIKPLMLMSSGDTHRRLLVHPRCLFRWGHSKGDSSRVRRSRNLGGEVIFRDPCPAGPAQGSNASVKQDACSICQHDARTCAAHANARWWILSLTGLSGRKFPGDLGQATHGPGGPTYARARLWLSPQDPWPCGGIATIPRQASVPSFWDWPRLGPELAYLSIKEPTRKRTSQLLTSSSNFHPRDKSALCT